MEAGTPRVSCTEPGVVVCEPFDEMAAKRKWVNSSTKQKRANKSIFGRTTFDLDERRKPLTGGEGEEAAAHGLAIGFSNPR